MDAIVKGGRNSEDRLSDLPDSVLISILSLLTPDDFVQTCILSKRWVKLWTFVPCLNFRGLDFRAWDLRIRRASFRDEKVLQDFNRAKERCKNVVTSFLRYRNETSDVHTFRLCPHDSDSEIPPFIRNSISYAVNRNLKNLILSFPNNLVSLPDCLFACQSLEELDLFGSSNFCRVTIEPRNVYLPRLRKLKLVRTDFYCNHFDKLLSGSPILESLSIEDSKLELNNFSSQSLRWLRLDVHFIVQSLPHEPVPHALSICAPAVENMKFNVAVNGGITITWAEMSKLTRAKFSVGFDIGIDHKYSSNLLSSLSNVVDLQIGSNNLQETLEQELLKCPIFYNLKNLILKGGCMCCAFDAWYCLVKHCPNLETLTLNHSDKDCKVGYRHIGDDTLEKIKEGHPLSLVQIKCSRSYDIVDELVKLIREMTQNLDGIEIIF